MLLKVELVARYSPWGSSPRVALRWVLPAMHPNPSESPCRARRCAFTLLFSNFLYRWTLCSASSVHRDRRLAHESSKNGLPVACGSRVVLRWAVQGVSKCAFVTAQAAGGLESDSEVLVVSSRGTASLELGSFCMRRSGLAVDDGDGTVQLKNGNSVVLFGNDDKHHSS